MEPKVKWERNDMGFFKSRNRNLNIVVRLHLTNYRHLVLSWEMFSGHLLAVKLKIKVFDRHA